jgi:hypothetical protein
LEKQAGLRCNKNIPKNIKNRCNYIQRQMSVSKIMKKEVSSFVLGDESRVGDGNYILL